MEHFEAVIWGGDYLRLLSVDIWDTVLRRICHPDDIKKATARYLLITHQNQIIDSLRNVETLFRERINCEQIIAESSMQSDFDDEYELHDVIRYWLETVLGHAGQETIDLLYEYELSQEKYCSYIDSSIVKTIESFSYDRLCYISDFYAELIDDVLEHHNFPIKFDAGYVSCYHKVNKRSGRLYDIVKAKEHPEQWIHIGDNPYSDVYVPKHRGIQAKHYMQPTIKRKSIEDALKELPIERHDEQLGVHHAIFFYAFVTDILEKCIQGDIKYVYYFTREGEFFKRIHEAIESNNPYGVNLPKAELLEVSRKSTFTPSLREVTLSELMRLWNQYSIQPISALFQSLGADITDFIPFLEQHQIQIDEEIICPWNDNRIQALFADELFIEKLEEIIKDKRCSAISYFVEKGIDKQESFAIVDIGWRGTIQDNLCYLFPEKHIVGFYVALLPFLNEQPFNARKHGYLNASALFRELIKCITPLEMICNSPNGSVLLYEQIETGTVAKRKIEKGENNVYYSFTQHFQSGILKAIPIISKYCNAHGMVTSDLYGIAVKHLYDFFNKPDKVASNAFFQLQHNEEFGLGKFIDKRTTFRPILFVVAIFSRRKRQELADFLRKTNWVQAYLARYHLSPLIQLYRRIIKNESN